MSDWQFLHSLLLGQNKQDVAGGKGSLLLGENDLAVAGEGGGGKWGGRGKWGGGVLQESG